MPLPEDRFVLSREYFEDRITFAMGGRAAEEIFFGRITTGASNDLQQATRMAKAMVMSYGMSDSLGLPTYGDPNGNPFLGREMSYFGGGRDYSEEAAQLIDREVKDILQRNYQRAVDIVTENKDKMVKLANTLMEVETLDREAFEQLMNQPSANGLVEDNNVEEDSSVFSTSD
jgi:cell division protease FtsH